MNRILRNLPGVVAVLALLAGCATPPPTGPQVELLWLGHSAFRITTPGGKVLVLDPWLSTNLKTPAEYKDFDKLGKIDMILVSHAHFDHFGDAATLAKKWNAPMLVPQGFDRTLLALGVLPENLVLRMSKGGMVSPFPGVKFTMVHAEHGSEYMWTNPATAKQEIHVGGEPIGYIMEMENGFKIYFMGDTGLFGDMKVIGEYYKPDLILIPIGGHFTMDPKDAAYATREFLRPKFAIPTHYATLPVLKGTPEEYIAALGPTSTKVFMINPGDKLKF
jgi:L-ascorbate metabolism protein UlaG (beta-lactamase superfamily)